MCDTWEHINMNLGWVISLHLWEVHVTEWMTKGPSLSTTTIAAFFFFTFWVIQRYTVWFQVIVKSKRGIAHIGGLRFISLASRKLLHTIGSLTKLTNLSIVVVLWVPITSELFQSTVQRTPSTISVPKAPRLETHQSLGNPQPQCQSTPSNDDQCGFLHVWANFAHKFHQSAENSLVVVISLTS